MQEMEPFENAANFLEDVGMFEAAVHAPPTSLPLIEIKKVLSVLDGSNQDVAVRFLGRAFSEKLNASLEEHEGLTTPAAIEDASLKTQAGLVVLPVPFGADIGELREESLGEIVDRVLPARTCPIMAVRQPLGDESLNAALRHVLVTLVPGEPGNALALAWACQLLKSGGELILLEIADREVLSEAKLLLDRVNITEATAIATLERVLSRQFASLVGVVQRTAAESGFDARVASISGRFVEQVLKEIGDQPTLVIHAGSKDRRSTNYHRSADLILGSRGPVLII